MVSGAYRAERRKLPVSAGWVLATLLALTAATDLARCGIGLTPASGSSQTVLLFTTGGLAAVVSAITASGAIRRRQWAVWSAGLLGIASAPQATMAGFRAPYTIPDLATAVLGLLLTVTVLVGSQSDAGSPANLIGCPYEAEPDGRG